MAGKALRAVVVLVLALLVLLALRETFFSPPPPNGAGGISRPPPPAPEFDVPPPIPDGPPPPALADTSAAVDPSAQGPIATAGESGAHEDGGSAAAGAAPSGPPGEGPAVPAALVESRVATRVEVAAGRAVTVPGGRAPELSMVSLLGDGLEHVSGTVEVTGERKPKLESGVPVGLTGRVLEAGRDLPVAGAEVVILSAFYVKRVFYDHHLREVARTVTDADGEYRIDRLNVDPVHFGRGGRVFLAARSPVHAPHPPVPLEGVTPGFRNRLEDIVLSPVTHTIRGRVLDHQEGKPVVGGRVVATGDILPIHFPKDQREALFLGAPETVTDEAGRFELRNVGPGVQWISIHGGNDCIGYQQVRVPREGEVEIRARRIGGRIEGTVTDEFGNPVSLVKVDGGGNSTHTFADGSFVLENFRGEVIDLRFEHPEYREETVAGVPDGKQSLVVRMAGRWPAVRLRVIDADTREQLRTVAFRVEPAIGTSPWSIADDGVHTIRVPSGTEGAVVVAEGYEPLRVNLTDVRDGETIEVALRRGR